MYELFFLLVGELYKGSRMRNRAPTNKTKGMPGLSTRNVAHASRLLFQPDVGSLLCARYSSHVIGFLKSNLLPAFLRNCDRGKLRSHTWHVIGLAAASMDACSLLAAKPLALSFGGLGQHSLHLMLLFSFVR